MTEQHFINQSQSLLDGKQIEVHLQDGTVWLSQKLMAELFQTIPHTQDSVIKESLITDSGKHYRTQLYRLD